MMRLRELLILALLSPLALPSPAEASARRGQALAKQHCAACHSIGRTGKSPMERAPPLRTLAGKYPLENLEEALAEGIVVAHDAPEMPAFEMEPQQIADLIAFLRSIQPRRR